MNRKFAQSGMFSHKLLTFSDMYAIDLVFGDKGLDPVVRFAQLTNDGTRDSGDFLEFLRAQVTGAGEVAFDKELFHDGIFW
jgi:hypothetical protein